MATTIGSSSSTDLTFQLSKLAPTFQTAIKATIDAASDPLKRVQAQKDQMDVRRGIYTDMKTNLDGLQSAVQALITTQAFYGLNPVLKSSITPTTAGTSVLTATNTSSAVAGDYDISVTQLAKAQSRATLAAQSPDLALGKSGTFWLGGTGTASVNGFTANATVTGTATGAIADGQRELGAGDYSVQVRDSAGTRQFRLVNSDGTAVSIRSKDGTSYSADWQSMPSGSYDSGRGLTLNLDSTGPVGATALTYTARGTSITIKVGDTQRNITSAINNAAQPEGRAFKASIVAGQLVLSAAQTGTNHSMVYTDNANLGFGGYIGSSFTVGIDLQAAQNAQFTVNGMAISRASNANLSDVVDGVTLTLAGDAVNKSARLSITASNDPAVSAMNAFVSKFNAAFTHLTQKLASTSKIVGDKMAYTRGPLTGDIVFRGLRGDMLSQISNNISNSGSFKNLAEIGLSFDKDLKLSFDSAKYNDALKNHSSDVTALLDASMVKFDKTLSVHTGTTGLLQHSLTDMDGQLKSYDQRISKYNENLNQRKQSLINQYQQMQSQLAELGTQAQMFGINLSA